MVRDMTFSAEHDTLARTGRLDSGPKGGPFHVAHLSDVMHLQRHIRGSTGLACTGAQLINDVVSTGEVHDRQGLTVDMSQHQRGADIC
jgi:hypothetical protein